MHQDYGGVVGQSLASAVTDHVIGKAVRRRRVRNQGASKAAEAVLVPRSVSGFNDSVSVKDDAGTALHFNTTFRKIAIEDAERQAGIGSDTGTVIATAATHYWRQVTGIGEGQGVTSGIEHGVDQGDETAGWKVRTQRCIHPAQHVSGRPAAGNVAANDGPGGRHEKRRSHALATYIAQYDPHAVVIDGNVIKPVAAHRADLHAIPLHFVTGKRGMR